MALDTVESELECVGRQLHEAFPSPARHPIKAFDQRLMALTSSDQELKAALFRFVDVTPACHSLDDLAGHLIALLTEVDERPRPLDAAMRVASTATGRRALGVAAAAGVRHMAHRFIVGDSPRAALGELERLWESGAAASVDLLGEATVTRAEADRYAWRCEEALDVLSGAYARVEHRPLLERDSTGTLARANLSVKVTALTPLMRAEDPKRGRDDAARRMRPLLRRARDLGAHVHIDSESLDSLETTMELALELLAEDELASGPSAGVVLQAYLRESPEQLERILAWASANERGMPLTVRLVKGAYWDHELTEARQQGWRSPVFEHKADSDRNFEALTRRLIDARPRVRVAVASHNLRSVAHAIAYNRVQGGLDRDLELQVLRGLGDDLQHALAACGFRVRTYCPVGDLVAGMAYLVRRLLENTANDSFLNEQARGAALDELLAPPA